MFSKGIHPQDRLFFTMMVGMGVIGSAIVLVALYVLTTSLDRLASESGNREVSLILDEWTDSLTRSTEDYAFWDVSYRAVVERDDEAVQTNLGIEPGEEGLFDWIAILDADMNLIYDLNLPTSWDSSAFFASQEYQAAIKHIEQSPPSDYASFAGVFGLDDNHFIAAATRITPDDMSAVSAHSLPYFIGGRNLDARALEKIAARTGSTNVFISESASDRSVPLNGPFGATNFINWNAELPGFRFRQDALPWVALICLVFVFLTGWMASYFRRLATSLEKMHKVATTDQLTGVANRAALTEILEASSVKEALQKGGCAVVSIDLDDFKRLNDEHGHNAGDAALRLAANRIRRSLRQNDKVIRMGGDEFVCLIFDPQPHEAAQKIVDRLKLAFAKPMDLGDCKQIVTPSIGIAISKGNDHWDALLERSDTEMYRAKRAVSAPKLCVS